MDRLIAAVLKNYWLQAGSSHEPVTGVAFVFWDVSVGTRGAQQEGRRGQKYLVLPHCVQIAERDVEYQI
ncbi:uncharacterized [Lates japonicus]